MFKLWFGLPKRRKRTTVDLILKRSVFRAVPLNGENITANFRLPHNGDAISDFISLNIMETVDKHFRRYVFAIEGSNVMTLKFVRMLEV